MSDHTDTTLTDTERAGMELLMCECGHDIGGEHNSAGCYHVDWGKDGDDRECDCTRDDDRDLVRMAGERHLAIVAARVAAAREEAATKVEAWGNRWEARAGDYRAPIDSIMRAHASRLHDLAADIRKGADRA